jgi:hypothetical protein
MTSIRRLIAVSALIASALAISGCISIVVRPAETGMPSPGLTAAPLPGASMSPQPDDGPLDCGGVAVDLSGDRMTFVVVGECPAVTVTGSDIEVDFVGADVGSLTIRGDRTVVTANAMAAAEIDGQDNVVDAVGLDSLTIRGDRNEVRSENGIDSVVVNGNGNVVRGGDQS